MKAPLVLVVAEPEPAVTVTPERPEPLSVIVPERL